MSQNATTGINNVDNVEQVLVANPGQTGSWQVVVSYSGLLTNSLQNFGLIISSINTDDRPLVINSISPATAASGATVTTDITGEELSADTAVRLRQPGRADIIGTSVQLINPTTLRCQFNLGGAASGLWSVVGTNPDAKTATLADAFTITGTTVTDLWRENFDGAVSGWSSQSATGSNSWAITTAQSHTPTKFVFRRRSRHHFHHLARVPAGRHSRELFKSPDRVLASIQPAGTARRWPLLALGGRWRHLV